MKSLNLDILLTKYRLALPGFAAALIGSVLVLYSVSSVNNILSTNKKINQLKIQNQALESQVARLAQLQSGELTKIQDSVDKALPQEKPVFPSLSALNVIAQENNVTISTILSRPGSVATPSAKIVSSSSNRRTSDNKDFEYIPITLEIVGPVAGTTAFMEQLLQINPLMELRTVRSSTGTRDQSTFSSEIDLEVYWQAEFESTTPISESSKIQDFTSQEIEIIEAIEKLRKF